MKHSWTSGVIAAVFMSTAALGAQQSSSTSQQPSPSTSQQQTSPSTSGQTPSTSPARTRTARRAASARAAKPEAQPVTLTGCIQAGDQANASSATGVAGTTGTTRTQRAQANPLPSFILANASSSSGEQSAAQDRSGATGAPRATGTSGSASASGTTGSASASGTSSSPSASAASGALAGSSSGQYMLQGMDLTREVGQRVEVTGTIMPPPASRTRGRSSSTAGTTGDAGQASQRVWVSSVRMLSVTCSNQ